MARKQARKGLSVHTVNKLDAFRVRACRLLPEPIPEPMAHGLQVRISQVKELRSGRGTTV